LFSWLIGFLAGSSQYCERAAARGRMSRCFTYACRAHSRHSHSSQVYILCRSSRCFLPSSPPTAEPRCPRLCQGCMRLPAGMQSPLPSKLRFDQFKYVNSIEKLFSRAMSSLRCSAGYKQRLTLRLAGTPPTGR